MRALLFQLLQQKPDQSKTSQQDKKRGYDLINQLPLNDYTDRIDLTTAGSYANRLRRRTISNGLPTTTSQISGVTKTPSVRNTVALQKVQEKFPGYPDISPLMLYALLEHELLEIQRTMTGRSPKPLETLIPILKVLPQVKTSSNDDFI